MSTLTLARAAALFAAVALVACGDPPLIPESDAGSDAGPDSGPPSDSGLPGVDAGPDGGPIPQALIRVVHAAPDLPPVDFRSSGTRFAPDVYYRGAAPYARVAVGTSVVTAHDASDPDSEALATSAEVELEDGERYLAVLMDPPDADPRLVVMLETDPPSEEPPPEDAFSVRILNATHDTESVDVDLDGAPETLEADDLAAGAWTDWLALDATKLRPFVSAGDEKESFTVTDTIAPWLLEVDQALVVIVGRPVGALPSQIEGLSILLVLPATETSSPIFTLRPDPRLAILQTSPRLGPATVSYQDTTTFEWVPLVSGLAPGDLVEVVVPPGTTYLGFQDDTVPFPLQMTVDLLSGHRYLMATEGDPASFSLRAGIVRDGIDGDGFIVMNIAPDTPGAMRWYSETSAGVWTAIEGLDPLAYEMRSRERGVTIDPASRVGLAREDRTTANVWFETPTGTGDRGFVVLAGSYFAPLGGPDALATYWVWAPASGAWTVERTDQGAGSGPLPDETPATP